MTASPALLNKDLFVRDPTEYRLPNDGVAKVVKPTTPEEWDALAFELETFVCDGEYEQGMMRILDTFLGNLGKSAQPAVWVSGFFGSGKSHFVRMLETFWTNPTFPDGQRARDKAHLPEEILVQFRELDGAGHRAGGLWSAAGMLSGTGRDHPVRMSVLRIVLESAGLPVRYGPAKLVLWLHREGLAEPVRANLERKGHSFDREVANMYVSTALFEALLDERPGFASSPTAARNAIKDQFPSRDEVDQHDFLELLEEVLQYESLKPGKRPLTLLVFDEAQQFIGEDPQRSLQFQEVVEGCSSRFGGDVLFVATGQAALTETANLQKLQGRFSVRVTLSDNDVERVVREVVLRKKEEMKPVIEQALDSVSGEISRHLTRSKIGPDPADRAVLVPDYPLLPTRHRFWEHVLRTFDVSGTSAQLRNQLKVVQEANREVALQHLGYVIGGDFIFRQLRDQMLQSGKLLRETNQLFDQLNDGSPDGQLKSRLAATIFIINQLPQEGALITGLKADADTLADLLVEDLPAGSADLRQRIPKLLGELVEAGNLLRIDDHYQVQTREGMQWEQDFNNRRARIANDIGRVADARTSRLREAVLAQLGKLSVLQGTSKQPRQYELHFGDDRPDESSNKLPVWVRDEWNTTESIVRSEARAAGTASGVVFVFLPKGDGTALNTAVARAEAARETLETRGNPNTPEGQEAHRAMQTRLDQEKRRVQELIAEILAEAKVYQSGGTEVSEGSLRDSMLAALQASATRVFSRFRDADFPSWERVFTQAQQGNSEALATVGFTGEVGDHPVTREVRRFIGGTGAKGREVREHFSKPPYGWPPEAIDAALVLLVNSGILKATRSGQPMTAKMLNKQQIATTDFQAEEEVLNRSDWIALRRLMATLGLQAQTDDLIRSNVPLALSNLVQLAREAGGDPPLPERPKTDYLEAIQRLTGNAQLRALIEARAKIEADFKTWKQAKQEIAHRWPRWEKIQRLLAHGAGLSAVEPLQQEAEAIVTNRSLLDNPDPTQHLLKALGAALRTALREAYEESRQMREREVSSLAATPEWRELDDARWQAILRDHGLGPIPEPKVETDDDVLRELDRRPLHVWRTEREAFPQRLQNARRAAVDLIHQGKVAQITVPRATISTEAEAEQYLQHLRETILAHLTEGKSVVI